MVDAFKARGGSFAPKLMETYDGNRLHGTCAGYDRRGELTFKDEYESGRRIKQKAFDPGLKWKMDRKLSRWAD